MGSRVTAVTPLKAQINRNFCQMAPCTLGWSSATMPALCSTSCSRSVRGLVLPPSSPNTILPGRLRDYPRRFDRRNNVGYRTDTRVVSRRLSDALFVADPVLEREKHSVWVDQWTNTLRCGVDVVGLDAEKNQVDGTDLARVVRGFYRQRERSGKP
jgi:hypothetical protein